MDFVNVIPALPKKQLFQRASNYLQNVFQTPRQVDNEFIFDKSLKKKLVRYEGWRVENSIFRDFKADNQIFLKECFEFDFLNTKIKKYVKPEELESVK